MNKEQFISLSTNIKQDTYENRVLLADKFDMVHSNIECYHDIAEAYYMAHHILFNQDLPGQILEFGCYKGGMSCKLSHVAKLVNKNVVIFDSFVGLLESANYTPQPSMPETLISNFEQGMFSATMNEVDNNLINYGEYKNCSFASGSIEKLLPLIIEANIPSFVTIDVDIVSTCMFIIENLWDKNTSSLVFFHESCIVDMLNSVSDNNFWLNNFGISTPVLGHNHYGTDFSLPNTSCLNFIAKSSVDLNNMFPIN